MVYEFGKHEGVFTDSVAVLNVFVDIGADDNTPEAIVGGSG